MNKSDKIKFDNLCKENNISIHDPSVKLLRPWIEGLQLYDKIIDKCQKEGKTDSPSTIKLIKMYNKKNREFRVNCILNKITNKNK